MDSFDLFSQAGSVTLSQTLTPMDSYELSGTLAASSSFLLELMSTLPTALIPMNSFGLYSQAMSFTLWQMLTHMDSYGLS